MKRTVRERAPATSRAWQWQATGTVWRIHHDGCVAPALAELAAAAVERDETRWSRFRADSEVHRLSEAAGSAVPVSPPTLDLLAACIAWHERTQGVFQPLVGGSLAAWGYRRGLQHRPANAAHSPASVRVCGTIEIDRAQGTARIPTGTALDLGGIAKGWIADRLARLLQEQQIGGHILVDAGGDLVAARGSHLVALHAASRVWLPLHEGNAVATSAWHGRSWRNDDGRMAHHLIDPATGAPGHRSSATVVAASATEADVLATTIALRPDRVADLAEIARVQAYGRTRTTPGWESLTSGSIEVEQRAAHPRCGV